MNKVNIFLLKLFLFPKALYQKLGCDVKQLEAILTLKLLMDDRRPNSFQQIRNKNTNEAKVVNNATLWSMFTSLIMGLFFLMFFFSDDAVTNITLFFFAFFVLLALTLISDFTNVLLDVRDNFIILPKPVSDRTFVLAKLLHIVIHIIKLVVPLALPTLIFLVINKGIISSVLLFPFIILSILFTVFFINAFYIFILKITTPEKFKTIITYVQIVFAIAIYGASQILPRSLGKISGNFNVSSIKGIQYLPMYWLAKAWNALCTFNFSTSNFVYLTLSVTVPVVCMWVVIKFFAPSFNQKLSQIAGSGSSSNPTAKSTLKTQQKTAYSSWWAKILTTSKAEKMGFIFTWKMMLRSRDFKVKVYPGIGYMIVIFFVSALRSDNGISTVMAKLHHEPKYALMACLFFIYFSIMMIMTALGGIAMSDKFKAAWIYFITPIYDPGEILAGSIKATIVMFFVPIAVLATTIGIGLIGFAALPNLLLAVINVLLITVLISIVSVHHFPFSSSINKPGFSTVIKSFLTLIAAGLIAVLHYFIMDKTIVVIAVTIASSVATYFLFKVIYNYNWSKILSVYSE